MRDYYKILGIARTARSEEIKRAYRALAQRFHPDHTGGNQQAEERFKEIVEAYATLASTHKRRKYDLGFNPLSSINDLLQLPFGQRLMSVMLPSASAAPQAGVDTVVVVEVEQQIIECGGLVEVINPRDQKPLSLRIEPGYQWCIISGMGRPARNGGDPADLYVYLEPKKAS